MQLKPGLLGTATMVVGEAHTAPRLRSGRAPVLATSIMIALMEAAAVDCVEALLGEGQESLGTRIDVDHAAGTPIGLAVTATAELKEVSGRKLTFYVEARDAREVIGKGRHERVVVDAARFRAKVQAKAAPAD
jgi:predicted thioesterase